MMKKIARGAVLAAAALLSITSMSTPAAAKTAQADVLWFDANTGAATVWEMNGAGEATQSSRLLGWSCGALSGCADRWHIVQAFDGGFIGHDTVTGTLRTWAFDRETGELNGATTLGRRCDTASGCATAWKFAAFTDIDQNHMRDLVWHNPTTGELQVWLGQTDNTYSRTVRLGWSCGAGCADHWSTVGTGDVNWDGQVDLLWHDKNSGRLSAWLLTAAGGVSGQVTLSETCGGACATSWKVVGVDDFDHDGRADVVWHDQFSGRLQAWLLGANGQVVGRDTFTCAAGVPCTGPGRPVGVGDLAE